MSGVSRVSPGGGATFRVVTWNVRTALGLDGRHAWPLRRRALVHALEGLQADVLCLQEVRGVQRRYLLRQLGPAWQAVGRSRGRTCVGEQCPVLVRRAAFQVVEGWTRWFGEDPTRPGHRLPGASHPRIATAAVLRWRVDGSEVGVVATHLDAQDEGRRVRSARQLAGWLDGDRPWVVAGDLNAGPSSPTLRTLADVGLHPALGEDGRTTAHRFTGATEGRRIDHVLTTGGLQVDHAWVATPRPGGTLASDHWPVVADLVLPVR